MNHPLRFGIMTLQNRPWATLVEHWKHIESLGYDSVWVGDHFVNPHRIEEEWLDGWTALAALAAQTHTIRLGTLVTNIIYRNPALVARQALTLDHISHGRLTLGIGATSERDPSHRMTGVEVWPTAERVHRFGEMIEIIDRLLRNEIATYSGRYYAVTEAHMKPAPIQRPRPPWLIAAMGPATLKIAAQYADTWNTYAGWNLAPRETLDTLRRQGEILDQGCAKLGRDPNEIIRSLLVGITADTPFASLDAFYDYIGRMQEVGITEFIFYYDYPLISPDKCMDRAMLERVAGEALPKLRGKGA